jgi:hypothetical protein
MGRRILFSLVLVACARTSVPEPPKTIDIPTQPPAPVPPLPEPELVVSAGDAGAVLLREEWVSLRKVKAPVEAQLRDVALIRRAFDDLIKAPPALEMDAAAIWVRRTNESADRVSRAYAAAFRASDATEAQRVEIALAGAEVALAWFRRLDAMGFAKTPAAWRTDPAMGLTFEEVSVGIGMRWRDEGLALVALCVATAKNGNVDNAAALACNLMQRRFGRVAIARTMPPKSDTKTTPCRCAPGDPLCSTDDWCD